MHLLTDRELYDLLRSNPGIVEGLDIPQGAEGWKSGNSPIQPSSIDLHIGDIFRVRRRRLLGDEVVTAQDHILKAGQTVMVTTEERLRLPADIAAFGFPPTSISTAAILMTNPGHVDPGFDGYLRFTLINMGREPFYLKSGDKVVSLLFARLGRPAEAPYISDSRERRQAQASPPTDKEVLRLGTDFLNIGDRARKAAKRAVSKAELRALWLPIILSVLAAVGGAYWAATSVARDEISEVEGRLEKRISEVEESQRIEERLRLLESEVSILREGQREP